jgi:flagellar motor switch protein FliN
MADGLTERAFIDGLVSEFTTAVESMIGAAVAVAASDPGDGDGWIVRIRLSGELRGTLATWIARADAEVLARLVQGATDPPDEAAVIDTIREAWMQATLALAIKDPFANVETATSSPESGFPELGPSAAFELTVASGATLHLSIAGELIAEPQAAAPPEVRATAPAPVRAAAPVTVAAAAPAAARAAPPVTRTRPAPPPDPSNDVSSKLELVLDIDLPLVVRFGRTTMSLKELSDLGPGSIVDMGRSPDAPVEMLVGDRVIARGEVVVVGGNYGVRILDLVSSAERIRALEEGP